MEITITPQNIIAFSALVGAIIGFVKMYNKTYDWVKHQQNQDAEIASMREEQQLLTYGILCCLKGLKEQGCNGPVSEAVDKIEKHLNEKAHKG